ncbi:terminase TerL endonuclease subunit [Nocardia gipuzkoensis]
MTNSSQESKRPSEAVAAILANLKTEGIKGAQVPHRRVETLENLAPANMGIRFVARYGLVLDPWQELVLRSWLSFNQWGKFSHSRCGLSVPRQCGKSALLEARALIGMALFGEQILFTAHNTRTAEAFFTRLRSFFENEEKYPDLAEMVVNIGGSTGRQHIKLRHKNADGEWEPWGALYVIARSKSSGRGLTVDVVLMDEAQELSAEAMEALGPTTAAAPLKNRQHIYCGTPPNEVANSEVFTRVRAEILAGNALRASWLEWSMSEGAGLDDPQQWAQANPALGFRLDWEELAESRADYSDEGFARERGGMWSAAVSAAVIDAESWRLVADSASRVGDPVAFAVDVSPDRSMASIAIAGARSDGTYHVEIIASRRGTDWVVPALAMLVAQWNTVAVVVDGPAASVVPELAGLRVPVHKLGLSEFAAACGLFFDAVMGRSLRHPDQPTFTTAIEAARKRLVGDLWVWGRRTATSDITPVVAATLALYGFVQGRPVVVRKTKRKAVTL